MKITEVRINPVNSGNLKAFVSIVLDGKFVVGGLAIMNGQNGLFVKMPSRKSANGEYKDTCYPITKEFRQELTDAILNKYRNDAVNSQGEQTNEGPLDDDGELPF